MSTPDFFRARLDQMIDLRHPLAPCRFVWKATLSLGHRRREWAGRQVGSMPFCEA
ncbi:hypothetical protein EV676_11358 [Caldimonas thermodepolymerans]|jgi:hypothetical protein|uniref:Uncharacterized protein n=1 Tax=Caldimonas thermodepolymerans TaxID=215580 RepID=A0AA46DAN5_9BURK|nr:hypothetical protein EV676_11358 [Caldimonas thermodepolymerans]